MQNLVVQLRPRGVRLAEGKECPGAANDLNGTGARGTRPSEGMGMGTRPAGVDGRMEGSEPNRTLKEAETTAYARGCADAEKRFNEQLLRQRREIVELQKGVLEALEKAVAKVVRETEESVVELALEVAQRLVSGMPVSREMIQAAVGEALRELKDNTECHVHVHPEDLALLNQYGSPGSTSRISTEASEASKELRTDAAARDGQGCELSGEVGGATLHFHGNPEIERGGCIVKTRFGTTDTQRSTKLEQLRKALLPC